MTDEKLSKSSKLSFNWGGGCLLSTCSEFSSENLLTALCSDILDKNFRDLHLWGGGGGSSEHMLRVIL